MAKNKLKDSFYWMGQDGLEETVDLQSRSVKRDTEDVKENIKHTKIGQHNFVYVSAKKSLVIGVVNEKGERSIFVARDYWEADYEHGYGWMKVEGDDESF